jgi:hypothetical protein
MGMVIGFPEHARESREGRVIGARPESATVIILPVIRIERYDDAPSEGDTTRSQRRRRRRRTSRSKVTA